MDSNTIAAAIFIGPPPPSVASNLRFFERGIRALQVFRSRIHFVDRLAVESLIGASLIE
jgi:hypothetical protein